MALLKCKEIRALTIEERMARLKDLRNELMREKGVAAMGGAPISPGKIRAIRTNIARILTIETEQKHKEAEKAKAKGKAKTGEKSK